MTNTPVTWGEFPVTIKASFKINDPCLETFLYESNTKLFMHLRGVCGAHLNYASERFPPIRLHLFWITPQINPDKSPFLIHASPFTLKTESGSCCIFKKPGTSHPRIETRRTVVAALRSNSAQRGDARRRAPSGQTPPLLPLSSLHHGFTPGARPALRRINFGYTEALASWEYAACAHGPVDLQRLDGNHVTAAGDHGTEQVRLADPREQGAPRQQKGTGHDAVERVWR